MSTTAGATAWATAATGSSAPSPGRTGEGASFTGGNTGSGVGAGTSVAGGAVASGTVVGAVAVGAAAIGMVTDSDDVTDRPKKNPPRATAAASNTPSAMRPFLLRGLSARGAAGAAGVSIRPGIGGADGHCGFCAVPLSEAGMPGAGVAPRLWLIKAGPVWRAAGCTGGALDDATPDEGRFEASGPRSDRRGVGLRGATGVAGCSLRGRPRVTSGTMGTRGAEAVVDDARSGRSVSSRGIAMGGIGADASSQIGGFGRSGS